MSPNALVDAGAAGAGLTGAGAAAAAGAGSGAAGGGTAAAAGAGVLEDVAAGVGVGLGCRSGSDWKLEKRIWPHTFETIRTRKSFSLIPNDSMVLSSVRILPRKYADKYSA